MQKKITLATVKAFIRKSNDLYINERSRFDGMVDCVVASENSGFDKALPTERHLSNTHGVHGAWFVGQSRDYFTAYNDGVFQGYEVYNCCGKFILATKI
jgi:hypothetical protein